MNPSLQYLLALFFLSSYQIIWAQSTDADSLFILGEVRSLRSDILSEERILNIYLPPAYDSNDSPAYPVIYLLDGSADEDFIHVTGIVQFANFPWVNSFPESIVVGIANTDRRRDFAFPSNVEEDMKMAPTAGGSARFIEFLEKELQPYVERKYRTSGEIILIGQSFGGLLATEILLKKPDLFSHYLIVSPSLWWDDESLLSVVPAAPHSKNTSVYIALGNEGEEMDHAVRALVTLLKNNAEQYHRVYFEHFPENSHADIMHLAVYHGLMKLRG